MEVYDNLSPDLASVDNYEKRINGISALIDIKHSADGKPAAGSALEFLTGGDDDGDGGPIKEHYIGGIDPYTKEETGLEGFKQIDDISLVCCPDEPNIDGLTGELVAHCENMKDRFAILQSEEGTRENDDLRPPLDSKYAAFYYPWIKIVDPLTGRRKLMPPCGHIAGVYARGDVRRGVHKAPANEAIRGAMELQFPVSREQQAILNPKGVNCLRVFPGRGIKIWGARTVSSDPIWKYVNVRRLFLYVEESIEQGTQWVVFEPNNEELWARVKQTITQFLTGVWKAGALMGSTPSEAFFVRCDRSTMTQDDIDNGRLVCVIGIAPTKPAEFVIFRIAQWQGGSAATE